MQLRCSYCQTMFPISREETLAALEHMAEHNQKFYDAHCPNCRRANRVERIKLETSYPGWQNDLKSMAREAKKAESEAAAPAEKAEGKKPELVQPPVKKTTVVPAKPVANTKTTKAARTTPATKSAPKMKKK